MGLLGAMTVSHSALKVETQRLVTSANNIANLNTPGFRPGRVLAVERPGGGVTAVVEPAHGLDPSVLASEDFVALSNRQPPSGTDLAAEIVNQMTASAAYRANLAVIKTADEMLSTAIRTL